MFHRDVKERRIKKQKYYEKFPGEIGIEKRK